MGNCEPAAAGIRVGNRWDVDGMFRELFLRFAGLSPGKWEILDEGVWQSRASLVSNSGGFRPSADAIRGVCVSLRPLQRWLVGRGPLLRARELDGATGAVSTGRTDGDRVRNVGGRASAGQGDRGGDSEQEKRNTEVTHGRSPVDHHMFPWPRAISRWPSRLRASKFSLAGGAACSAGSDNIADWSSSGPHGVGAGCASSTLRDTRFSHCDQVGGLALLTHAPNNSRQASGGRLSRVNADGGERNFAVGVLLSVGCCGTDGDGLQAARRIGTGDGSAAGHGVLGRTAGQGDCGSEEK